MLRFVLRRALVQRRMLGALVVLITASSTMLGVSALLLGRTQDRAFAEDIESSQPQDVDVTAFLVDVGGPDLEDTRQAAQDLVRGVLAKMDPTLTSSATSRMRLLEGDEDTADAARLGYLGTIDAPGRRADLTSGRWPADVSSGPPEATVPQAAATRLDLSLGDLVTLGRETGLGAVQPPVTVVVVGTFRPRFHSGWDSDPLSGAGFEPGYSDGSVTGSAFGPFLVTDAALRSTGSSIAGVRVTADPDLRLADDATLRAASASLGDATGLLSSRVGGRAHVTRVASDLPVTLTRVHAQQATTRSTVLVVLSLGALLSLVALLLAGRVVAATRDDERALLIGLGISRGQQLGAALVEAVLLAGVSAALAVPIAAFAHSRLTHLPAMRAAGLEQGPTVTTGLVLSVVLGALLLTLALVVPALEARATGRPSRRRAAARSGVDVALVVAAVTAWWQLHSQPSTAETSGDLVLTVAPVLFLVAVTTVAVRVVPLLLGLAAGAGTRSPRLLLPLAAQQAARRPHTGTAMVLLATAVAAATFGVSLRSTWERSQVDQAALRVGTDLSFVLPAPATPDDEAAVLAATSRATGSPVVSAVTARNLALGHYVGDVGSPPVLVAVDSLQVGSLLRGRNDGPTWERVGAALAPSSPVTGLALDGSEVQLQGTGPAGIGLSATPTVVVQDAAGFRTAVSAAPVPLDGRPHPLRWQRPLGAGQVVAVRLQVEADPSDVPDDQSGSQIAAVSLELLMPGAAAAGDDSWQVTALGRDTPVHAVSIAVDPAGSGTVLRTSAKVDLTYLAYIDVDLLATAFEQPSELPVAISQRLSEAIGAKVGGDLSATIAGTVVPLRVVSVVPTVPSAPARSAVLADGDLLSRALIASGRLDPVVDGWWVADPSPRTVRALQDTQLGEVTTRRGVAASLAQGPLRVTVPAALVLLLLAGAALLLAGAGLLVSVDQARRSAEVARLRALGLTRRSARWLLLTEHLGFLVPLVLVGATVGAVASVVLGPSLIRSDIGDAPVPGALVVWPWSAELGLLGGLLLGCVVIAVVAARLHVRRAETAQLRVGDS